MTGISEMERAPGRAICCLLAFVLFAAGPLSVYAQVSDVEPPVIEYEPVNAGGLGEDQLFVVEVTDNNAVESVIFSYRISPESSYEKVTMERTSDSDSFSATVLQSAIAESSLIEYYFEATDVAGNRTLEGFAFNPLSRTLVDASELPGFTTAPQESGPFANLTSGRSLLYVALGILAVGVLVAASDDGGGSDSEQGVDVTVVVDQLPIGD